MSNRNNKDDKLIVLQTADNPKIFNAVTPQPNLVARKLFAETSGVFCRPPPQISQYLFLDARIERPELFSGSVIPFNLPSQRLPLNLLASMFFEEFPGDLKQGMCPPCPQ